MAPRITPPAPTNGVLFGLVDTHPGQQPPLTAADYQYGVHIRAPAANYQKIVAGVENDVDQNGNPLPAILDGTAVSHMDMIDVSIHQSNVAIEIHQCVNRADPTNPAGRTASELALSTYGAPTGRARETRTGSCRCPTSCGGIPASGRPPRMATHKASRQK